jgi:hypothetical protein
MDNILNRHGRRREKVFGEASGVPLDGNAKARIMVYARAWTVRHRQAGQHLGPLTWATLRVLEALVRGFHNSRDGRCFPSYETIAARAQCHRTTVYEAIKALEAAEILTWVNRLIRVQFRELDLFGEMVLRSRLVRTSNAYVFRDPMPCAEKPKPQALTSKSTNPVRTPVLESYTLETEAADPDSDLERALAGWKTAFGAA